MWSVAGGHPRSTAAIRPGNPPSPLVAVSPAWIWSSSQQYLVVKPRTDLHDVTTTSRLRPSQMNWPWRWANCDQWCADWELIRTPTPIVRDIVNTLRRQKSRRCGSTSRSTVLRFWKKCCCRMAAYYRSAGWSCMDCKARSCRQIDSVF